MISIEISEETTTVSYMVEALRYIASLLEQGYTSGYSPDWNLSGEEDEES